MADLTKMLESLSEEEKKELKAKLDDLYKAEDEREIDKIEEEKADNSDEIDEKKEEVEEESEEVAKDVDEIEEKIEDDKDDAKSEEGDARLDKLEASVAKILELLDKKAPVEEKAKEIYGLGNGVFQNEEKAEPKKMTASDIASILNSIKR